MKKIRAIITVDLKVKEDLSPDEIKTLIGVGKYRDNGIINQEDEILLKDKDFEIEEYVDIKVKKLKRRV